MIYPHDSTQTLKTSVSIITENGEKHLFAAFYSCRIDVKYNVYIGGGKAQQHEDATNRLSTTNIGTTQF